jgi:hypothetical protein
MVGDPIETVSRELIDAGAVVPTEHADARVAYPIAYDWAMAQDSVDLDV